MKIKLIPVVYIFLPFLLIGLLNIQGCTTNGSSPPAGILAGTVTDRLTENPVAEAQISTDPLTVTTTTGEEGTYLLEGVPEGEYTVIVEAERYETGRAEEVLVEADIQATADFLLERELSTSCAKCHLDLAMIQADLEANPLPDEGGEEESSAGEG